MEKTNQSYILEKDIWTENDFEKMGWHDATIYGFVIEKNHGTFTADLVFDIDYIFDWIHPVEPEIYFSFWIAPCTIVFKEAFDLKIDIEIGFAEFEFEVADLHLVNKSKDSEREVYEWNLELQQGNFFFKSYGFDQIVRKKPIYAKEQILKIEERGGICFNRQSSL